MQHSASADCGTDHGRKIAEGSLDEVQRNPAVIQAYLGAKT
jgi:ABC-type branched-subunit amino acid transport system ATPase component